MAGDYRATTTRQKVTSMNNKFDELTKSLAQSLTRRAAFKKFGVGLAGMALAAFGLAGRAEAAQGGCLPRGKTCGSATTLKGWKCDRCCSGFYVEDFFYRTYVCL
jgi:hypothetical protein